MIKAVLFDFDHTLYDRDATLEACAEPFMRIAADYLREDITEAEMASLLCRADREGVYCGAWKKSAELLVDYGIYKGEPLPYNVYTEQFSRGVFPKKIRLFDDTIPTLQALRDQGFRIGMLTNGYVKFQWDKLHAVPEIHPYFEIIRVGEELSHPKPHPQAFLQLSGEMGLLPHEIAFVGDNPISDICGARSVGMLPIWMRYVKEWPQEITPPPHAIDSLSELPALLAKINKKD